MAQYIIGGLLLVLAVALVAIILKQTGKDKGVSGTITGGSFNSDGGGVYNNATFNMYGGVISNNTANRGGGVYNNHTFTMYGGVISQNTAKKI